MRLELRVRAGGSSRFDIRQRITLNIFPRLLGICLSEDTYWKPLSQHPLYVLGTRPSPDARPADLLLSPGRRLFTWTAPADVRGAPLCGSAVMGIY